jgi:hypothetical protein
VLSSHSRSSKCSVTPKRAFLELQNWDKT